MPVNSSSIPALITAGKVRRRRRRKRYASGGSPTNPALWGVDEEELPAGIGLSPVTSAAGHIAKGVLWDLPHRAVDAAKGTSYGLRREDFTDVPPDYSPDPNSPLGGVGVNAPKGGWQPTDELIGASLEGAANVMGGTALSAPAKAAGEMVVGAGPRDPALWHGISKVRLPKPISEMSAVHVPTQQVTERMLDPASLQGGKLLPLLGDRTGANTNLMQVNGYRFNDPVPMQGGHGFMAANEGTGAAWASGKPVASGIANRVAREGADAPVYGVYTAMGERSGDFSHHVSDTLSEMLPHAKISKAARREFDDDMRGIVPDWPGLKNEALRPYLADADGATRKAFIELMDTAKYQKEGFPSVAEARFATTDPRLLNVNTGDAGLSVAKMEGRMFTSPGQHRTYDTNVGGQYVGGFGQSIPKEVMYPDIVKPLQAYRDALPGYKPTVDYLMSRSPKGLPVTQQANQQWVDSVSKYLEGQRGVTLGAGATDKRAASLAAVDDILEAEKRLAGATHEPAPNLGTAERPAATPDPGEVGSGGGGPSGARSLDEAQTAAARWAGARPTLEGQQGPLKIGGDYFVPGPIGKIHDVAEDYMRTVHPDRPYTPPTKYHQIDPEHSKAIAQAYEDMKHTPNDPATKASYDALIDETAKQYQAIKATGLKIEPIPAGMPDPYATNPRLAARDVAENNHLWFFPTEGGFGTVNKITDNPMLRKTGEKIGDHELLANDMFRVVHDYFGHLKEGHGFRAAGEDNAWRTHAQMYSDLARPAMTTETRGQNSWVNYGPHGEKNRTASGADTTYADQKVGLMPEWTMRDRGSPEPIIAYHGSPYSFDRFSSEHLNRGEGNQGYGQGLYFASHSPVSEWYRHQLASRRDPLLQKYGLDSQDGAQVGMAVAQANGDAAAVAADFRKYADDLRTNGPDDMATANMIKRAEGKAAYLEDAERSKGHMYEVAIDARPEQFLDWDAPLAQQPEGIRNLFSKEFGVPETARRQGGELHDQAVRERGMKATMEALKKAGVAGIKYLDQASRSMGKGTRNYVTFDDNMISILRKYGIIGIPAAGVLGADGEERRATGGSVNAALDVARAIKRKKGGKVHVGPIVGDTGGRADKVPMSVPDGAYVIPADIVSGLGEGNTGAGMVQLGKMFPKSKPRIMRESPGAVPILAADGEFVVSPESILDRWDDLDYGHQALDAWVLHERQQLIETLEGLDPPAQD